MIEEKHAWMTEEGNMPDSSDNLMLFKIPLDCPKEDLDAVKKHQAAVLAASKLYNDYFAARKMFPGISPEAYAESWIPLNLIRSDREFDDLVVMYFVKILLKMSKERKSKKPRE